MPVAEPPTSPPGDQYVGGDIDQHEQRSLEQRQLDLLAAAGVMARIERGENGIAGQHAGTHVDDGDAVFGRRPLGLAADAHQAGLRLENEIIAGQRGLRAAGAIASDRAAHRARRMGLEPGIGEAPFRQGAELEIIDDHVGLLDQAGEHLLAGGHRHVQRHRALVAVGAEEIGGLAGHERRSPAAGIVAAAGRLDLDDVGAHVAEHHGAERAGENAGEIEHADAGQRASARFGHELPLALPPALAALRMEGGALRSLAQPSR